jgi:hypothetical protein
LKCGHTITGKLESSGDKEMVDLISKINDNINNRLKELTTRIEKVEKKLHTRTK